MNCRLKPFAPIRTQARRSAALALLGGWLCLSAAAQAATETRTSAFEYDPLSGLLIKEVVEPDDSTLCLVSTYGYDSFGNKIATSTRNCNGSAGSHPGLNSEAAAPAPSSNAAFAPRSSSSGYSADGRFATSATNALGHGETREYDPRLGTLTRLTGPNGLSTEWKYDGFGRKVLEKRADGNGTQWRYEFCSGINGGTASCPVVGGASAQYVITTTPVSAPIDLVAGTTGPANGPYSKVYFDQRNREIRSETQGFEGSGGQKIYKDTEYNELGRVARSSRPYFYPDGANAIVWTSYEYDVLGRLTKEASQDDLGAPVESTIDYNGLITTATNARGQTQVKTLNVVGQLANVTKGVLTASDHETLNYAYDPLGNLVRTTDTLGNQSVITYDRRGRKTSMSDPDMGAWAYEYNALGELVKQIDAKTQVSTLLYDLLGRLVQKNEPDLVTRWYYDRDKNNQPCGTSIGKLCQAESDNGYNRSHGYDSLGRQSLSTNVIDAVSFTTSISFDANGRMATQTYPTGLVTRFVYSDLGYLQELRNDATGSLYWRAQSIDAEGRLTGQAYGNGVQTTQTYSAYTGRIRNIQAGAGNSVQNLAYAYDVLGNVDVRQDNNQSLLETFGYDALNRMTQSTLNANLTGIVTTTYAYDPIGNMVCKSDLSACSQIAPNIVYGAPGGVRPHAVFGVLGLVHGANNPPPYSYDANGNMVAGAGNNVAYTSFNMARQIWHASRDGVEYLYGSEHQRIREYTRAPGQNGAIKDTTIYLHPDMANGLFYERVLSAGTTTHKHYLTAMGVVIGLINRVGTTDTVKYLHRDNLGSVTTVTDASGAVLERLAYDPWGKRRQPAGVADPADALRAAHTDRGFTNHEHVDTLGLINMNGRFFDPSLGRFMSADPFIQSPDVAVSYNRYAYCWNNPVGCTDPTGYWNLLKSVSKLWRSLWRNEIVRIGITVATGYYVGYNWMGTNTGIFGGNLIANGAAAGFAGAFVGSGGDLKAGLYGAASGAAFGWAGDFSNNFETFGKVATHAAVGCVTSEVSGGECGSGAMAAGFGKFATLKMPSFIRGEFAQITYVAMVGGTASMLGGGKFANGAVTAAYGYLFNHCSRGGCTTKLEQALYDWWPGYKFGTGIYNGEFTTAEMVDGALSFGGGLLGKSGQVVSRWFSSVVGAEELVVTGTSKVLVNAEGRGGIAAAERLFDALPRSGAVTATETPLGVVRSVELQGGGTASIRPFSQTNPGGATVQINAPGARTVKIRYD